MTDEVVFFRLALFLISVFALLNESVDAYIGFWFFFSFFSFFLRIHGFTLLVYHFLGFFFSLNCVYFTICCLGLMLGFFVGLLYYNFFFFRF